MPRKYQYLPQRFLNFSRWKEGVQNKYFSDQILLVGNFELVTIEKLIEAIFLSDKNFESAISKRKLMQLKG